MMNEIEEFANECENCEIHYSDEADDKLTHYASEEEKQALTKQNRFRSWALWLSIFGEISVIFTTLNLWDKIGITSDTFSAIVNAIGFFLTLFGIVNNPTKKGGW